MCDHHHNQQGLLSGAAEAGGLSSGGLRTRRGVSLSDGRRHQRDHRIWSRRQFLGGLGLAIAGSLIPAGGSRIHAWARSPLLDRLAAIDSDRVLILIQLSGGNDGLNTVIPVSNDLYYQNRPTLAIPGQDAVTVDPDTGLHPRLDALYGLYSDARMSIIHGVGYPQPDLSHFTSTDVWVSGSDVSDIQTSGWLGRTLDREFPDFSNDPPEKPLAVQLGGGSPLLFQSSATNMGMSLPNLQLFDRLVTDGQVFDEEFVPETVYGSELAFVRSVANASFRYADAIQDADADGSNLAEYPGGNSLANDLSVVARLIRGSLGSSIYHLTLGGFDTHAGQAGRHDILMRTLADGIAAFMADLSADGLEDRVLVATFSEFGRRVQQNASGGTDHGTAAPMFVFGGSLAGGMFGDMPSLSDLDAADNLKFGVDFRSVYATMLVDWLGLDETDVPLILGQSFERIGFVDSSSSVASEPPPVPHSLDLGSVWPNPFRTTANIDLTMAESGPVTADLFDARGRRVKTLFEGALSSGPHTLIIDGSDLAAGAYFVRMRSGSTMLTRKIVRVR